jgi:hypothetical protein
MNPLDRLPKLTAYQKSFVRPFDWRRKSHQPSWMQPFEGARSGANPEAPAVIMGGASSSAQLISQNAGTKVGICRRAGSQGLPPLDTENATTGPEAWQAIYKKDVALMKKSDIIIANLMPFAGASADAGTLIEVGWFLGKGKPIFGYSKTSENFESRMRKQLAQACRFRHRGFPSAGQSHDCRSGPERRIPGLFSNRRQSARLRCARRVRDLREGGGVKARASPRYRPARRRSRPTWPMRLGTAPSLGSCSNEHGAHLFQPEAV